jgi:hypothetical protein
MVSIEQLIHFGVVALIAGGVAVVPVLGQVALVASGPAGIVRLQGTDLAVLEAGEKRDDLPCTVTDEKATREGELCRSARTPPPTQAAASAVR